jgi:hypothetical protein
MNTLDQLRTALDWLEIEEGLHRDDPENPRSADKLRAVRIEIAEKVVELNALLRGDS